MRYACFGVSPSRHHYYIYVLLMLLLLLRLNPRHASSAAQKLSLKPRHAASAYQFTFSIQNSVAVAAFQDQGSANIDERVDEQSGVELFEVHCIVYKLRICIFIYV